MFGAETCKIAQKVIFCRYEIFHCFYCHYRCRLDDLKSDTVSKLLYLPVRDMATHMLKSDVTQIFIFFEDIHHITS